MTKDFFLGQYLHLAECKALFGVKRYDKGKAGIGLQAGADP